MSTVTANPPIAENKTMRPSRRSRNGGRCSALGCLSSGTAGGGISCWDVITVPVNKLATAGPLGVHENTQWSPDCTFGEHKCKHLCRAVPYSTEDSREA